MSFLTKLRSLIVVISTVALINSAHAYIIDWEYQGFISGKAVWVAKRAGACAWINHQSKSQPGKIGARSKFIAKRKGDKLHLRPGQGLSNC